MSKNTNPLGKGTRNLTSNVSNTLYLQVAQLAAASGCGLGEYLRTVLEDAVENGVIIQENAEDRKKWIEAVNRSEKPLPKIRLEIIRRDKFTMLKAAEKPTTKYGRKAS